MGTDAVRSSLPQFTQALDCPEKSLPDDPTQERPINEPHGNDEERLSERLPFKVGGKSCQEHIRQQKGNEIRQQGTAETEQEGSDQHPIHHWADRHQEDLEKPDTRQAEPAKSAAPGVEDQVSMLPEALQRSEGPAKALFGQSREGFRRLGPGDGVGGVGNAKASPVKAERQISILGQGIRTDTAHAPHGTALHRADGTGDHGNTVELMVRTPIKIEAASVLQCLAPGNEGAGVAHLGMT